MNRVPLDVRSRMMAAVGPTNTAPELLIRRALHAKGFRYRLHDRRLPGTPDIVLPKHRAVIEVRGCFWHGHRCYLFRAPGTNTDFWQRKIAGTIERDRRNRSALSDAGWRVAIVWECAIRGAVHRAELPALIDVLSAWLAQLDPFIEFTGGVSNTDVVRYRQDESTTAVAEPVRDYAAELPEPGPL